MKKILLTSAVCVFAFTGAAVAQENTITIIHEDGSQDVIELGGSAPKPAPERRAPKVEVVPKPAESVIFKTLEVVAEPVVPRAERVVTPVAAPNPKYVDEPEPPPPLKEKPKPKKKPKAVAKKKVVQDSLAVIPPRKPHKRVIPTGDVITKEKALYIALSEAPPAKDVQVYPRESAAGLEYSVIFKTEEGGYEVVVDGVSGVIKSSGKIKNGQALVKPGHLPSR